MGRVKRNALRDFAVSEYKTLIACDQKELDLFDHYIADTLCQDITIALKPENDEADYESILGVYLLDDDIE
jgi:hypothetical protein